MNEIINNYASNTFESIKHIDENGTEYWCARELQKVLEYKEWRKFENVINKAKTSCVNNGANKVDHFVQVDKMINLPKNAKRHIVDYNFTRYVCYLIVQNADV